MHDFTYIDYLKTIHSLFNSEFLKVYREENPKTRRKIIPYIPAIHRRWYYATFVENTPLSPANMSEALAIHFEKGSTYQVPVIKNPAKMTKIDVKAVTYSLDDHPVAQDLRVLADFFTPFVDLKEDCSLSEEQEAELSKLVTLGDLHYVSFLFDIACKLKMFKKLPSLHMQRMEVSKKGKEILELSNEELFRKIVDTSIHLSAVGLHDALPLPERIFTENFIRRLLTQPLTTDTIFDYVLGTMGFELEDFMSFVKEETKQIEPLDLDGDDPLAILDRLYQIEEMHIAEEELAETIGKFGDIASNMTLMAGTYVLGIVLDRFFFTPFGQFLRLIRPQYEMPFDFKSEISSYMKVCRDPDEAMIAFFAPCSKYTITMLGHEYFGMHPTEETFYDVNRNIHMENMKDTVLASLETLKIFINTARVFTPMLMQERYNGGIHTFRVRLASDKSKWVHMQVSEFNTLQEFYYDICDNFTNKIVKRNDNYSFFHDKVENRFTEYPAPTPTKTTKVKKTQKKPARTANITLENLDFDHMNHMILTCYNQSPQFDPKPSTITFHIERLNVRDGDPDEEYPILTRCSASVKELHTDIFKLECGKDFDF